MNDFDRNIMERNACKALAKAAKSLTMKQIANLAMDFNYVTSGPFDVYKGHMDEEPGFYACHSYEGESGWEFVPITEAGFFEYFSNTADYEWSCFAVSAPTIAKIHHRKPYNG